MARLNKEQWEVARADFEVRGLSMRDIATKYNVNASTVSRRASKEGWTEGKAQHIVSKKFNAIKDLEETQQEMQQLNATQQVAVDAEVAQRLLHEKIFTDAALSNQKVANRNLETWIEQEGVVDLEEVERHARITQRNKETVLGKNPDTAIQINNNGASAIDELVSKRVHGNG